MEEETNTQKINKAILDPLTGLENKAEFIDNLDRMKAKSARGNGRAGVYLIKVDSIYEKPDLLKKIANCIKAFDFDHATRYGNTFAAIKRFSTPEENQDLIQQIKEKLEPLSTYYCQNLLYVQTLTDPKKHAEQTISELEKLTLDLQ